MQREKGIMGLDMYKEVMLQVRAMGTRELKFTPIVGDPLVDKTIIEKIRFAKFLNCFRVIYMYTNLIGLKDEEVNDLVTSGLTALTISTCLQGEADYHRIFGVDSFNEVMNSIIALLQSNKRNGSPIDIVISLKHDKGFDLNKSAYFKEISGLTKKIVCIDDTYDSWSGLIKTEDLPRNQLFKKARDITVPCAQLYTGFVVTNNGDIAICWCRDLDLTLKIGNIYEEALVKIWRGQRLKRLRDDWLMGRIPSICHCCLAYSSIFEDPLINKYKKEFNSPRLFEGFIRRVYKKLIAQ